MLKSTALLMALYLAAGSCFPGVDFSQIGKFDTLLDHYREHRQLTPPEAGTFTFIDFLAIHFLDPGSHQIPNEDHSHEELPFQQFHLLSSMICPASNFVEAPSTSDFPVLDFHYHPANGQDHVLSVFQPPTTA